MDNLMVNSRLVMRKGVVMHVKRTITGVETKSILAKLGAEVHPEDILAVGQASSGFRTVHLATELQTDPKKALSHLKRKLGERIYEGEVLAQRNDFFGIRKKLLLAPTDGVLDLYDDKRGELKIKLPPQKQTLVSGLFGIVDKIDEATGTILIRSMVDLGYGVLGSGKERGGILKFFGNTEQLISSKQLSQQSHGQIVVGGGLVFLDAIEKAIGLNVMGIIAGGINASDYKAIVGGRWNIHNKKWSDVGVSVMVTEGFGSISMGQDIFELLKSHDGKFAIMDGNRARITLPSSDQNSMMYVRKTQLPTGSYVETEPLTSPVEIKVGMHVRIVSGPLVGTLGVVKSIDQSESLLPSGLNSILITIETKQSQLKIPFQNIEALVEN